MSIVEVLSNINDRRKGGDQCQFNGYLEDYLETLEDSNLKTSLNALFVAEPNQPDHPIQRRIQAAKRILEGSLHRVRESHG
jgi:hypothetical protein